VNKVVLTVVSRVSVVLASALSLIVAYSAVEVFISGGTSVILLVPAVTAIFAQATVVMFSVIALFSTLKRMNWRSSIDLAKVFLLVLSLALCVWSLPCIYEKYVVACSRRVILPEFEFDYSLLLGGGLVGFGGLTLLVKQILQDLPKAASAFSKMLTEAGRKIACNKPSPIITEE